MKKLSELSGDQFMDALYAVSPLLPILENIDIAGFQDDKKDATARGLSLFVSIITKLIPTITSREYRHCVWELLSILDEKTVEEIKSYPAGKILLKIKKIFAEGELTSFLSYADASE